MSNSDTNIVINTTTDNYSLSVLNAEGPTRWGLIVGTLSAQTDLYSNLEQLSSLIGNQNSSYTVVNANSANWDSTYSTVNINSAISWNYQGTDLKNLSSGWIGGNDAYTNLVSNSAAYLSSVDLSFLSVSGNWNDSYNWVSSNSANATFQTVSAISLSGVFYGDGSNLIGASLPGQADINTLIRSNSAEWNDAYNVSTAYRDVSSSFATIEFTESKYVQLTSYTPDRLKNGIYELTLDESGLVNLPGSVAPGGNARIQSTNSIDIYSNTSLWTFGTDGVLSTPGDITSPGMISVNGGNSDLWNNSYTNLLNLSSTYASVTSIQGTIYQIDANNDKGNVVLSLPQSFRTPGDLNVGGNLFIAGSGITLSTSTLTVSSPIIYINNSLSGENGNVYDIGLVGHFKSNIYQHTGLVRSAQNNYWSLFSGLTTEPLNGPTINYNDPTFTIDTLRANILGSLSGDVVGNITGNADTVTNGVYTNGSYSDPSWITSLADTKITGTKFATDTNVNTLTSQLVLNTDFNNYKTSVAAATATLLPTSIYQSASSSFATNTALNSVSSLLTPLTLTNTLTSQLVTNNTFNSYQTNVAAATATLLPTSIYQSASSSFATNTLVQSTSALLTPLTLTKTLTSQLVLNTAINTVSGNWNSAYQALSTNPYILNQSLSSTKTLVGSNTSNNTFSIAIGGSCNTSSGIYSTVVNGFCNQSTSKYSNIAGGARNTASGYYSNVVSGFNNQATGIFSFVAGKGNTSSGQYSVILGGFNNIASGNCSSILGGQCNDTKGFANTFILGSSLSASRANYTYVNNISSQGLVEASGGNSDQWNNVYQAFTTYQVLSTNPYLLYPSTSSIKPLIGTNTSNNVFSTVLGGNCNLASGPYSTVVNGFSSCAIGYATFVGSGSAMCAVGDYSIAIGGTYNIASGTNSIVGGGYGNTAGGVTSTITGGYNNITTTCFATVVGGGGNKSCNIGASIIGGVGNTASGQYSSILGGRNNIASGNYSGVLGGCGNNINAQNCAFIIGAGITAPQANYTYVNNLSSVGTVYGQRLATGSVSIGNTTTQAGCKIQIFSNTGASLGYIQLYSA